MTANVSFYLMAILALRVKSFSLQERNVLIVDRQPPPPKKKKSERVELCLTIHHHHPIRPPHHHPREKVTPLPPKFSMDQEERKQHF